MVQNKTKLIPGKSYIYKNEELIYKFDTINYRYFIRKSDNKKIYLSENLIKDLILKQ